MTPETPKEADSPETPERVIAHDWAAKIVKNPDGTVTYTPFPEKLPGGTENSVAKAIRDAQIPL